MGFQSGINQALGAVAGATLAVKGEQEKKANEEIKAKEAEASKQLALKKEDKDLSVKEAENALAMTKAQHDVDDAQKEADKYTGIEKDKNGIYRKSGKFVSKKTAQATEVSRYNLDIMKKALDVRKKEQEALTFQRAQWKLNMGGTK